MSGKNKKWVPYLKKTDGDISINVKSNWYAVAQGQLHITGTIATKNIFVGQFKPYGITGRTFMYLIVWLGAEFTIKKVKVDHSFWNNFMKEKLKFFFNEAMIKELANPRKARKMELRKYNSQTKKFI